MFVVSVGNGQEVIETVARAAWEHDVPNAAIVSLLGAVGSCCVSMMPKGEAGVDVRAEYDQPFQLSGTGEIRDGTVHIHCVLGGADGTVSGHLHWAKVDRWFANVYVMPL